MNAHWREIDVPAPHSEGWAWAGLVVVYGYDDGGFSPDHFEIWHQSSGELMLELSANLERAMEIAEDLADVAEWSELSTVDETMLQLKLMAFAAGYADEVMADREWAGLVELDRIVPFGPN